ncbi:MAG: bile acid:sodium symporter [Caldisphaeraceae archaeon]|nr:bile acid:sodium symporter [Caldisphaeraceae archaeon]MEB3798555.1 bile acid:sodium symporter [Caldisphaeraceae archaeon]
MGSRLIRLASHLRKYLLFYVLLVIAIAIPLGYHYAWFFKAHVQQMKILILSLAVSTLYPSMVQLKGEEMGPGVKARVKETIIGVILIFIVAPFMAMLSATYISYRLVAIGFVASNAVPASSASIAYVMLAEGNVELATVLAIISIVGAVGIAPLYVGLYARSVSVSLPVSLLAESVAIALVLPLVLGQLTRYFLVKRRAKGLLRDERISFPCKKITNSKMKETTKCIEGKISANIRPYLSLATMVFMLLLISVLIANKAGLLIRKPTIAVDIIIAQFIVYAVIISLLLAISKAVRMKYEDHMGIIFIAMTKNESVAAAMAVMAIGPVAALPAALVPTIQPVIAIAYIAAAPFIASFLKRKAKSQTPVKCPALVSKTPYSACNDS